MKKFQYENLVHMLSILFASYFTWNIKYKIDVLNIVLWRLNENQRIKQDKEQYILHINDQHISYTKINYAM